MIKLDYVGGIVTCEGGKMIVMEKITAKVQLKADVFMEKWASLIQTMPQLCI